MRWVFKLVRTRRRLVIVGYIIPDLKEEIVILSMNPMRFEVSFQSLDVQLKPKTH